MEYIPLTSFNDYIEAHIIAGRLEEEDIACWLKDENTVTINPMLTNAVGGIKLMVAAAQLERAQELILQYKQEKEARFCCPRCHSGNIQLVNASKEPANWFFAIISFLVAYALPLSQTYHCFQCGADFKEPKEMEEKVKAVD